MSIHGRVSRSLRTTTSVSRGCERVPSVETAIEDIRTSTSVELTSVSRESVTCFGELRSGAHRRDHDAVVLRASWWSTGYSALGLLLAAYIGVLVHYSPLSLQDFPNHLARASVLADLLFHHGERFGEVFGYHFLATPYILGDLMFSIGVEELGVHAAAQAWCVVAFLSLPCALLFYLRTTTIARDGQLLLLIVSLYLSTDWFFLMGFLEFRLGIALTLIILALAQKIRSHPSVLLWLTYLCTLGLGYGTHLSVLIFASTLVGSTALLRIVRGQFNPRVELGLTAPCLALLAGYFGIAVGFRRASDLVENPYLWGPVVTKIEGLAGELYRYGARSDTAMFVMLLGCVAAYVNRLNLSRLKASSTAEPLFLAAVMFILYVLLPRAYSEAYFVDVRALPFAALFAIVALMSMSAQRPHRSTGVALGLAIVLAATNLGYLQSHFATHSRWLRDYRALVAKLPPKSAVFPIYTQIADGRVFPFRHAWSFALIDRDAKAPYLQTGDTGNPQKYVRYSDRPYAPPENWSNEPGVAVDWSKVACQYRFVLATQPFNTDRLKLSHVRRVGVNGSAALFEISPDECGGAQSVVSAANP